MGKQEVTLDTLVSETPSVERSRQLAKAAVELLPVERSAAPSVFTGKGHPELDAMYPRFDFAGACERLMHQPGVPFPVPRFAHFDVESHAATDERRVICRGYNALGYKVASGVTVPDRPLAEAFGRWLVTRCRIVSGVLLAFGVSVFVGWYVWAPSVAGSGGDGFGLFMLTVVLGGVPALIGAGFTVAENWAAELKLTCKFSGAVPAAVRERIRALKSKYANHGMSIILLCEVDSWQQEVTERSALKEDPLVLAGINGAFYLVDKFDLTPWEDWVSKEYTGTVGK